MVPKNSTDKTWDILKQYGIVYPGAFSAEILAGLAGSAKSTTDKKPDEQSNRESFKKPEKPVKPLYKTYEDLACGSAFEEVRCRLLIKKLKATVELLSAQQQYYDAMSDIARDNEMFGFDLSI